MADDGSFTALGDPKSVELDAVKERVSEVLEKDWLSTSKVLQQLSEPKPSDEQARQALTSLAEAGAAERDPPISDGKRQGVRYRWRTNLSSNGTPLGLEEKLEAPPAGCVHRPPGEADGLWQMDASVWGDDAKVCSCCGALARGEFIADGLCPTCRNGAISLQRGGHLVRMAMDQGLKPVEEGT